MKGYRGLSLILCLSLLFCSGCADKNLFVTSFDKRYLFAVGNESVTVGEYNMVLLDVQRQYENYYQEISGTDIWNHQVEDGRTFADYIRKEIVLDELVTLQLLQILAEQLEITLSQEEEERIQQAASEYMDALDEETISFLKTNREQAASLMRKYILASKVIAYYSEQTDLEVSENEARTIRIQSIPVADEQTAAQILERIEAGESFQTVAEQYSDEELKEYNIVRGELTPEIEEIAFSLAQGECSQLLETAEGYCLIYCVDDYLEDMTELNQQNIIRQRIYQAWDSQAEKLRSEMAFTLNENQWKKLKLAEEGTLTACFFETYNKWFDSVDLQEPN